MNPSTDAPRRLWRFHGGVKLTHHKEASVLQDIAEVAAPDNLLIALDQVSGGRQPLACRPGQRVLRGQALTIAQREDDVPVHAPTSGTVLQIATAPLPIAPQFSGTCIELIADGRDECVDPTPLSEPLSQAPEILANHLRQAGIAGLGGALYPTHRKIAAALATPASTMIINGAECEPFISCDEVLMRERTEAVIRGASLAAHAVGARRIVIALEDRSSSIRDRLQRAADNLAMSHVEVVPVPTIYPEGGERQLIQVLTGQEVPSGRYPPDIGITCLNVATAAAMDTAVTHGVPLTRRIVTVTGPGMRTQRNFEVPLGMLVSDLVEHAGGYRDQVRRLVMGGPMMGLALPHDHFPITKATNCILALEAEQDYPNNEPMPCIRCAACVPVCPARLLPHELFWQIQAGNLAGATQYALADCIECGCCAHVCPSHIPLVDYYRFAKSAVAVETARDQNARKAQARWQAHQRRDSLTRDSEDSAMARMDQELNVGTTEDPIAAAIARAKAKKKPGPGR